MPKKETVEKLKKAGIEVVNGKIKRKNKEKVLSMLATAKDKEPDSEEKVDKKEVKSLYKDLSSVTKKLIQAFNELNSLSARRGKDMSLWRTQKGASSKKMKEWVDKLHKHGFINGNLDKTIQSLMDIERDIESSLDSKEATGFWKSTAGEVVQFPQVKNCVVVEWDRVLNEGEQEQFSKEVKEAGGTVYIRPDEYNEKKGVTQAAAVGASKDKIEEIAKAIEGFQKIYAKNIRVSEGKEGKITSLPPKDFDVAYDNGGKTVDRYTVFFKYDDMALSLSSNPDEYQGFSQYGEADRGNHLGKKISWKELPENVKNHIVKREATTASAVSEKDVVDSVNKLSKLVEQDKDKKVKKAVDQIKKDITEKTKKIEEIKEATSKKQKWTIQDWAGNYPFEKNSNQSAVKLGGGPVETFDSFEDAYDFLSQHVEKQLKEDKITEEDEENYEKKYEEYIGEYEVVEANLATASDEEGAKKAKQIVDNWGFPDSVSDAASKIYLETELNERASAQQAVKDFEKTSEYKQFVEKDLKEIEKLAEGDRELFEFAKEVYLEEPYNTDPSDAVSEARHELNRSGDRMGDDY